MNPAFKHLESKLRVGELTVGQWVAVALGFIAALVWGLYLSPLGSALTILTSTYLFGLPAVAAFLVGVSDFDVWLLVRCAVRWWRGNGRFLPGAGDRAQGYVLTTTDIENRDDDLNDHTPDLDLEALWAS